MQSALVLLATTAEDSSHRKPRTHPKDHPFTRKFTVTRCYHAPSVIYDPVKSDGNFSKNSFIDG